MSQVGSNDMSIDTYPSVFKLWKSARTTLTRAIDDYLTASLGLCDALCSPVCHPSSRHSLEQTLSEIDLELLPLQSEEDKLRRMRTTLANQRNQSRTLSPIHRLPPEILATVFSISSSRYTKYDRTALSRALCVSPTVLAGVCTSWRQLALQSPSLWAYVDIVVGSDQVELRPSTQTKLWIERSRNVPLYVNLRDYSQDPGLRYTVRLYHVMWLVKFLAPLMHRICALDINAALEPNTILSEVLECWIKSGSANVQKTLQVFNHTEYLSDEPSVLLLEPTFLTPASAEEFNTFFRTVSRLSLRNCGIANQVMFHEGLVELHLEEIYGDRSPTQQEFVAMLAACPRLCALVLANCWVEPSEETPSPINLNHLQSLTLETADPELSLAPVLPLLVIGSDALAMGLTLEDNPSFIAAAEAFFNRTKVATLCVRDCGHISSLAALLSCPTPYLEILAIERFDIHGQAFRDFFGSNGGCGTVLWPHLHTLYLKELPIDASCLQKLVLIHPSIKKLYIYRPRPKERDDGLMMEEESRHLAELMHDMVEDFCIDFRSGNGPIDTWDFVVLED
ncbi:hypothetical protein FRC08_004939 [Ceratobasidium sp. 394]|nr:hypothetical protein FRC08_004939 [Ceratobasidium sp. 394]